MMAVAVVADIVRRTWAGIIILSLLLASFAGDSSQPAERDGDLSINERTEAFSKIVASPSLFTKPVTAPVPSSGPVGSSPFAVFRCAVGAGMAFVPEGARRGTLSQAGPRLPWLRSFVRVVELRI